MGNIWLARFTAPAEKAVLELALASSLRANVYAGGVVKQTANSYKKKMKTNQ